MRRIPWAATVALLLVANACGSGDEGGGSATAQTPTRPAPTEHAGSVSSSATATTTTTVAPTTAAPATTTPIPPGTYGPKVADVIAVGLPAKPGGSPAGPIVLTTGQGALWAALHRSSTIRKLDPTTGELLDTFAINARSGRNELVDPTVTGAGAGSGSVVVTDDAVWVLDTSGLVWRLDPTARRVVALVKVRSLRAESGAAIVGDRLIVLTDQGVAAIDTRSNSLVGSTPLDRPIDWNGTHVVVTDKAAWLPSYAGVVRIDPATLKVTAIVDVEPKGFGGFPLGEDHGLVWAARSDQIYAIDPATNEIVRRIPKAAEVGELAFWSSELTDGVLWSLAASANSDMLQLVRIELAIGKTTQFDLMKAPLDGLAGIAAIGRSVWVSDFDRGNLLRVDLS